SNARSSSGSVKPQRPIRSNLAQFLEPKRRSRRRHEVASDAQETNAVEIAGRSIDSVARAEVRLLSSNFT
ncbi:MAG TPA: hypothetical protein VGG40_01640, partial [Solirubrobacterales bacterium]